MYVIYELETKNKLCFYLTNIVCSFIPSSEVTNMMFMLGWFHLKEST